MSTTVHVTHVEPRSTGVTRTNAVAAALRRELDARREYLDSAGDVVEVQVRIKLQPGTTWIRGIIWQEEKVSRSHGR